MIFLLSFTAKKKKSTLCDTAPLNTLMYFNFSSANKFSVTKKKTLICMYFTINCNKNTTSK